jgi:hypothetical protein
MLQTARAINVLPGRHAGGGAEGIAGAALLVYLRRRYARRVRRERMTASLQMAVRLENGVEEMPASRRLLRAS